MISRDNKCEKVKFCRSCPRSNTGRLQCLTVIIFSMINPNMGHCSDKFFKRAENKFKL